MPDNKSELKGFLYQKNGTWILADQPNLKSCCLNEKHCTLVGDFSQYQLNTPLKVRGSLCVTESGNYLTNVVVVPENKAFPYWTLLAVILILALFIKRKRGPLLP